MLRNQQKSQKLLKHLLPSISQQQCLIHQCNQILYNKSTNIFRQGKIMGKLFGNRVSGSKKRWFPSTDSTQASNHGVMFKQSQFGKVSNGGGGKNATRRMTVLNKLFMKHVTDLMATGEISESILGKGLQVSRVKISQDFAYVNVFWLTSGEAIKDAALEHELQRCSGLLRHELSQLGLMGVVPRIKFVKDKLYANMNQVEALLRNMDFGSAEEEDEGENQEDTDFVSKHAAETLKEDFYGRKVEQTPAIENQEKNENSECLKAVDVSLPEMRHDVLGLDHKGIMLKILTKMRKSKKAWDQHLQNNYSELDSTNSNETCSSTIPSTTFEQLNKINEKLAKAAANSEKFEAFLAKRKERRNTPQRKKFRVADHYIEDVNAVDHADYTELIMSPRQRKLFEAEDYLLEEVEERKYK